jgi:uncharacterized coiled-coil DUF342 family protein
MNKSEMESKIEQLEEELTDWRIKYTNTDRELEGLYKKYYAMEIKCEEVDERIAEIAERYEVLNRYLAELVSLWLNNQITVNQIIHALINKLEIQSKY